MNESTRVMPAGAPPGGVDRTMVAPQGGAGAGGTMMGGTVTCAVCRTSNPGLETYCVECGFLLASSPGVEAPPEPDKPPAANMPELVEAGSGRRFPLRYGINTVGRENCDVLIMDGTVSRRHASLMVKDDGITVTDLGSTNGTQVEGVGLAPNQETPVGNDSTVRFGNASFTLVLPAEGAEATALAAAPESTMAMPAGGLEQRTMVGTPGESEPAPAASITASADGPELVDAANGRRYPLMPGTNTVGRENADVQLTNPTVSRRHAQVIVKPDGVMVMDLDSTNGTHVGGVGVAPTTEVPLTPGTVVQFGEVALTLAVPSAGGEAAPAALETAEQPAEEPLAVEPELVGEEALDEEPVAEAAPIEPPVAAEEPAPAPQVITEPAPEEDDEPVEARLRPTSETLGVIEIIAGVTTIGRRTGNDVVLAGDPYISGRHADIHCDPSGCYIVDVGSTNGTVVNGKKLGKNQKQLLLDGDEVGLGQGRYLFETVEHEEPVDDQPEPVESGAA